MSPLVSVFLWVLNFSLIGGAGILIVLVARAMLGQLPKKYAFFLWLAPAYLLVGFTLFESSQSFGLRQMAGQTITGATHTGAPDSLVLSIAERIPALAPTPYASMDPLQLLLPVLAVLWLLVAVLLVVWSFCDAARLHLQLRDAQPLGGNLYCAASIRTPFVMGVLRPRIYLPATLDENEREYIVLHEKTHIRRGDHMIKPLAFLLLCVHWFNPLCWLAFYLMSRDMEMSCDEAVVRKLGSDIKKPYAGSLLALAAPRAVFSGSPLAFGEGHAGGRIKNLLKYHKPAAWATVMAFAIVTWLMLGMAGTAPPAQQGWLGQLYSQRTSYIGDNTKMSQIAGGLHLPQGMSYSSGIVLETAAPPYRAEFSYKKSRENRVNYPVQLSPKEESELYRNAIMAFALVQNMGELTFSVHYAGYEEMPPVPIATFTREQAALALGGDDPWERSKRLQDFEQLYRELNLMIEQGRLVAPPVPVADGEITAEPAG